MPPPGVCLSGLCVHLVANLKMISLHAIEVQDRACDGWLATVRTIAAHFIRQGEINRRATPISEKCGGKSELGVFSCLNVLL